MTKIILAAVCGLMALILGGCAGNVSEVDLEKVTIKLADVRKEMDKWNLGSKVLPVDSRGYADYQAGHLPGAINLGLTGVSGNQGDVNERLAKYSALIVYGNDPGTASARALAKKMMSTGYSNVKYFPEGLAAWEGAKLPVEKGSGK
jgi:rhodanese-related sulfurtransferase